MVWELARTSPAFVTLGQIPRGYHRQPETASAKPETTYLQGPLSDLPMCESGSGRLISDRAGPLDGFRPECK
jgi:hypothetical protein